MLKPRSPWFGSDDYALKFGIATEGGGTGDIWMRAYGGSQRLLLWMPGGAIVYSNEADNSGVTLAAGSGSWASVSDRARKETFAAVDGIEVLGRLAQVPISTWNYRTQAAAVRHIGPMAQDFAAAFAVNENDTTISTVDADGVALAAIRGLHTIVREKEEEISGLKREVADLRRLVNELLARTAPGTRASAR